MNTFNPMQWTAINVANYYGLDKKTYQERLDWVKANLSDLESHTAQADDPVLYAKAVQTLRLAQKGEATGAYIFLDASCSGLQIMSALTGCIDGAKLTNLVDPHQFYDAYSAVTEKMNQVLADNAKKDGIDAQQLAYSRKIIKQCVMVHFYGGANLPKETMGQNYELFLRVFTELAQGASQLLDILINSWNAYADGHAWQLPDGHQTYIPVLQKQMHEVQMKSIDYTLLVSQTVMKGKKKAVSNAANVVHSIDAYVLRQMVRRCNYDADKANHVLECIKNQLANPQEPTKPCEKLGELEKLFNSSEMVDPVAINYISKSTVGHLSHKNLRKLKSIIESMLKHKPFELVTVHDAYGCHPNNVETMRKHYNNIMADLADSDLLGHILCTLYKRKGIKYPKLSNDLSKYIRNANYAIS